MSNKPKKNDQEQIEEAIVISETKSEGSVVEFGELMGIVLDYYANTGDQPLIEGDEWKKDTEYMPRGIEIPEDLDGEVKKAFIAQIKKYQ